MRSPSPASSGSLRNVLRTSVVLGLVLASGPARALDDCPPGSSPRSDNGFTWCEPSVCANDGNCRPDEVCRKVALCMQVGTVDPAGCSDLGRCLAKTTADKMGLLAAPGASAAPASSAAAGTAGAKTCGCSVPGAEAGAPAARWGGLAALGLLAAITFRRRR
jgi:MYXO-CTERM domain-containing protein